MKYELSFTERENSPIDLHCDFIVKRVSLPSEAPSKGKKDGLHINGWGWKSGTHFCWGETKTCEVLSSSSVAEEQLKVLLSPQAVVSELSFNYSQICSCRCSYLTRHGPRELMKFLTLSLVRKHLSARSKNGVKKTLISACFLWDVRGIVASFCIWGVRMIAVLLFAFLELSLWLSFFQSQPQIPERKPSAVVVTFFFFPFPKWSTWKLNFSWQELIAFSSFWFISTCRMLVTKSGR